MRSVAFASCLAFVATPSLADGDARAGAAVFRKCSACHTATEPANRVGPSLMGVVGRPVASFGGYNYSDAMKAFGTQGKVWDEVTLSEYLLSPRTLVSGTRMSFPGLRRPSDIVDLIAYLKNPTAGQ